MAGKRTKSVIEDRYYQRLISFLKTSNSETERGRALVAASLVEEMLEEILRAYLLKGAATKKLFEGPQAPLSSLSAKTAAARSLGLISDREFTDIELLRRIRNHFAHSVLCSFQDARIIKWAKDLKTGMEQMDALEPDNPSRVDDTMTRFTMVTTSIVSSLYNRAHYVSAQRVNEKLWPD